MRIMTWEGCGRIRQCPALRYYTGGCLEGVRKTTKILSQDNRFLGRELGPKLAEYEAK
jgi:hypothetical protein